MDGKRYYSNYFSVYFDVKERYNPLDYFCMGIIEKVEDPARNQKLCAEMIRKLKIKVKTSTEKFKALCSFVYRGVFRTQLNIHDGAVLRKQLTTFGR